MNLNALDLNLLVVLEILLAERSVTRSAERLGRTQPAISHALARLREVFDDQLLVRHGRHLRPTVRGQALAESLPRVLDLVRQTVAPPEPFDPASTTRVFRLAAPDFMATMLPELLTVVRAEAPRAVVELVSIHQGTPRDVAEGRFDALIAPPFIERAGLHETGLGRCGYGVYGRRGHPAFEAWSAEAWGRAPHLRVRTKGRGPGPVDVAAKAAGIERRAAAVIPQFAMAPSVLAHTDLLLTVPDIAVEGSWPAHGLDRRAPPFELPSMQLSLYRGAVLGSEPGGRWLTAHVERVVRHAAERASARAEGARPPARS